MASLIVEHDGRRLTFDGSAPVVLGRDASCDVSCDNPAVSRIHARVALEAGRWTVTDESTLGTFMGNERIRRVPVDRPVTLRLGDPTSGEPVRLLVDDPFARPQPLEHGTVLVPADATDGLDRVTVEVAGRTVVARAGEVLRIGRDAASEVLVDDPIVSRHHARVGQRGDRWVLEDVGSSRGTFVDGVKVPQVDLAGRTVVRLGDPSGPELVFAVGGGKDKAAGGRRFGWSRRLTIASAAVVVLLVGLVAAFLFTSGGGEGDDAITTAKKASVWLVVRYPDSDREAITGSGTLVSEDGLILTAAHVVARDAPGLAPSLAPGDPMALARNSTAPQRIDVYTYVSDDRIELTYTASVVEADGYLDLAVVQIDKTTGGADVTKEELDLPHVDLGDSGAVATGDDVRVLGFPNKDQASSVSVYRDSVSNFGPDPLIGRRAWIHGSAERVSPGSSGGALVDDQGQVVGVTISTSAEPGETRVDYRPSKLAEPLVDAAEKGGGYEDERYVRPASTTASFTFRGLGSQQGCSPEPTAPQVDRTQPLPYVYLDYAGLSEGQAVYVSVRTQGGGDELGGAWQLWTDQPAEGCRSWPVDVPKEAYASYDLKALEVAVSIGPSHADLVKGLAPTLLLLAPLEPPGGGG